MVDAFFNHNRFRDSLSAFMQADPHLAALSALKIQFSPSWWKDIHWDEPGIYMLTGGRQIGKSTSCKLMIKHCLEQSCFPPDHIFYFPCDEVFDAKELSQIVRHFVESISGKKFLLIIDEVTYVKGWDRVIKALADEGYFREGLCFLTGSDTIILKEAAMRFPGRRGKAARVDFHLYPLSFAEYVQLIDPSTEHDGQALKMHFERYLQCGGYLRAINDLAEEGEVSASTFMTYEQWIRGDFLTRGKSEETLIAILNALLTVGVSQISYSALTQKIGLISKETLMDYCRLLERMDLLINLQAYDQNKKQGFPRKDRKFHFTDPFIYRTLKRWLKREGVLNTVVLDNTIVEACVAGHCHRLGKTFYFKGQGEIDVIWLHQNKVKALEVKWAEQIRPADLKMLKQFKDTQILTKREHQGEVNGIQSLPVPVFLKKEIS